MKPCEASSAADRASRRRQQTPRSRRATALAIYALGVPLDVLMVRKIGAPGHEEYGIGAVVDGGAQIADLPTAAEGALVLGRDDEGDLAGELVGVGAEEDLFLGGGGACFVGGDEVVRHVARVTRHVAESVDTVDS